MRKADMLSIFIILGVLILTAFGSLIYSNFIDDFGNQLNETLDEDSSQYSIDTVKIIQEEPTNYADNIVFWFFVAIIIAMFISSSYLEFEPVTIILMILVGLLAVGGAIYVSSMYQDFITSDPDMLATSTQMSKTTLIFGTIFPIIIFITMITSLIIMYNKKGEQNF